MTRRVFLWCVPALALANSRGQNFPGESVTFPDEATENEVQRLTSLSSSCYLPPSWNHVASSKGAFLLYTSDRTGSLQAYRLDLRSGNSRLLTEANNLNRETLLLQPDEKSFSYFDGPSLRFTNLGNLREREIHRANEPVRGLTVSEDSQYAAFIEGQSLMLASVRGPATVVVSVTADAEIPLIRPKRAGIVYRRGNESLWLCSFDGTEHRRLKTSVDSIGMFQWSPDGRSILYLAGRELREHVPDSNTDQLIAKSTPLAAFDRNPDASVFLGASQSKASPYLILLLRVTKREFALCEHRASDPAQVNPVFAPSSQRIYFQSDREGVMAIYSMAVDKLVEKTET